nr:MAG TPA: hypothetical protein [Caudoviricetes sp.]
MRHVTQPRLARPGLCVYCGGTSRLRERNAP